MKLFSYTYNRISRVATAILMLFSIIGAVEATAAGPYLVTDNSQVTGETLSLHDDTFNLDATGQSEATIAKDKYFYVDIEDTPISIDNETGLIVLFGRWSNEGSPKATKVEGSEDGTTWDILGYSYMQFRGGNGTIEYSKPIYGNDITTGKKYKSLRFKVLKTALGYANIGGQDCVRFNKFNIFLLKNGEEYPDGRIDPWRHKDDYYTTYKDYKFKPTNGILSPRNHYGKNKDYPSETPWGEKNTITYEGKDYELPTFHMQGDNQMPHVTEHTVYAMPGEIIPLVPYIEMPNNTRYDIQFSHWYKYNKDINGELQSQDYTHLVDPVTGERLLDFLVDPAGINITDNAGYFGGNGLPMKSGERFVIRTKENIEEFSNRIKVKSDLEAILAADIDLEGASVMIEGPYSGSFNGNGHTISNLNIQGVGNDAVGFFKTLNAGASIRNLRLENCNVNNGGSAGILIGQINSVNNGSGTVSLSNIMITGNVDITGNGNGGALVGNVGYNITLNVNNAGFVGSIISNNESAALIGNSTSDNSSIYCSLKNCYADAIVKKYKIDKWDWNGGYYNACAAVMAKRDNTTFENCVFNILTHSTFSDLQVYSYAEQSDVEYNGSAYRYEKEKYENTTKDEYGNIDWNNPSPRKIYIEKDNWNNFVLILKKDNEASVIFAGCDGWETIENIKYGYFILPDTWNSNGKFAIMPYVGSANLKTDFDWNMSGLFTVIQQEGSDEKDYNMFIHLDSNTKAFEEMVSENTEIREWDIDEESNYPLPPMTKIDDKGLQTTEATPEKFLSHNPKLNTATTRDQNWYGTTATFFKALDTSKAPGAEENLILGKDVHSYDIAVDFSHEFEPSSSFNLDDDSMTIYSPIINFRHIFHVVSGKEFADDYTSSKELNQDYISRKRRIVTARAGKEFHVRLPNEFPVPYYKAYDYNNNIYSSTNFYYKSGENQYDRARGFAIEVLKDGVADDASGFRFEENLQGVTYPISLPGKRQYEKDGTEYFTAGGEGRIHRMLECKNPSEGTYIVRIYALDDENNPVHVWNDPNSKIYMMEYVITFVEDGKGASFTKTIPTLHKDSYLSQEDVCGNPVVFLNFDEYKVFEDPSYNQDEYFLYADPNNLNQKAVKWPTTWSQCTYSFGYGEWMNYDYNEYVIANHASQVHYGSAAQGITNPDGSKGLYDRLYYDTDGKEKGFFYYVNAASDPGVTSRLKIEKLCLGSTVVVTAWVAEFSGEDEIANVAFNFSAVMSDGTRQRLHTFVTGYIAEKGSDNKETGEWYHVYYSFVPTLPETLYVKDIDHYELEVENNCKSSKGADYAVDDIRAYIVTPEITATQLAPVCDNRVKSTGVRLRTRFDKLLNSQGITEADEGEPGDNCTMYIAIFDKDKYDSLRASDNVSLDEVLEKSLIKQLKNDKDTEAVEWVGMSLSTQFTELPTYDPADQDYYKVMGSFLSDKNVEYMYANIRPFDEDLHAGKQYYISIYLVDGAIENAKEPTLYDFAVSEDACAKYGTITLQGSGVIKVDGFAHSSEDALVVCLGQSPVVQVELMMIDEDKKTTISKEKYYYDWYMGGLDEFSSSVYQPLTKFRLIYPDATSLPKRDDPKLADLTDDEYNALDFAIKNGWLLLHQSSYVFPQIKSADDQLVVTAMPIVEEQKEDGIRVCAGPNEIRLTLNNTAPRMLDGFDGGTIDYPKDMADVPLRVGLRQLRDVCTKITDPIDDSTRSLEVPLRAIKSYKSFNDGEANYAKMEMIDDEESDPYIYLVESNDPLYKTLTSHPGTDHVDNLEGLIRPNDKYYGVMEGLLPVGMLTGMKAESTNKDNAVKIVFSKDMQFREGYYYRLRFDFKENLGWETDEPCDGQVVFTIKVVPEYQQWTGDVSRNWNNDANWQRVAKTDLFLGDEDTKIGGEDGVVAADHTTDEGGNNDNLLSYAPLDFTKVIIPAGVDRFPVMFSRSQKDVQTLQGVRKWDEKDTDTSTSNHTATKDIKYDMASWSLDNVLACRPWYANTCDEIHFQSGAELVRQQYFKHGDNYQKAWADLEVEPNRWYTLTAPLQQVVAGDMYTISDGAKQNTELFQDITFEPKSDKYGRFKPAVYQRSWNKDCEAEVYSFGDDSNAHTDAAAGISLNWSRVYNQVDVNYSGGEGFSINARPQAGVDTDVVRFRLPKADTMYKYYTNKDQTEAADDKEIGERENRHKLNEFPMETKLSAREESQYFLVGNPFIARMDMKKFFDGNKDNLTGKYWIMSDKRQMAYLWNVASSKFISTSIKDGDEGAEVAPMQGFFVEAKSATESLTVKFTDDMIADGEGSAPLKIRRNDEETQLLIVSAIVDDEVASRAVINLSASADAAYDDAEDAAMLIDPSLKAKTAVYTVAAGKALAINSLDRIVQTEVGVAASEGVSTTLLFEGVDAAEGVKLLDAAAGEFTELYEGMTYEVEGSAAGRLYLVDSDLELGGSEIAVVLQGQRVSVVSTDKGVKARVFDTVGVCLGEWESDAYGLSFDLPMRGIMIVEASSKGKKVTHKFVVK